MGYKSEIESMLKYFIKWNNNLKNYPAWWSRTKENKVLQEEFSENLKEISIVMKRNLDIIGKIREDPELSTYKNNLDQLYNELEFIEDRYRKGSKKDFRVYPLPKDQLQSYGSVIIKILRKLQDVLVD